MTGDLLCVVTATSFSTARPRYSDRNARLASSQGFGATIRRLGSSRKSLRYGLLPYQDLLPCAAVRRHTIMVRMISQSLTLLVFQPRQLLKTLGPQELILPRAF